ncbi:GAF and ANTAR domain-containing protein [Homoserinimonas sp. A447]
MTDESAAVSEENPSGSPLSREDLCGPFFERLPITGASVSLIGGPGQHSTICASDAIATRVDALQFELGEGPRWKAFRTGRPVLVPDISDGQPEWPIFGAAVQGIGVSALFAFPLVMGAVTVGVVDLYRSSAGALSINDVERALALAGAAAGAALRRAVWSAGEEHPDVKLAPELRREVHQATGMILAQLDTSATEAFARLRAHAFSSGQTIEVVARDVVMRRLDFRGLTE